jgi:hypothetical protein
MALIPSMYDEINAGDDLAIMVKRVFFSDIPWSNCGEEFRSVMICMKKFGRIVYGDLKEPAMITRMGKYTDREAEIALRDILEMEKENPCIRNSTGNLLNHILVNIQKNI